MLGQHHDTVVARDRLLVLTEAADRAGESAFTYGRLHQRLESRALGYERSAERVLARVPKPQL